MSALARVPPAITSQGWDKRIVVRVVIRFILKPNQTDERPHGRSSVVCSPKVGDIE